MRPLAVFLLAALPAVFFGCRSGADNRVVVCSKNFTEQVILAELLAQQVEARTGLTVDRRVNLGGTFICHQALRAGQIDFYVEYTGTALTAILGEETIGDPSEVYSRVKEAYAREFDVEWLAPLGFENTFAIIVRGEDARRLNLRTVSDAAPHTPGWIGGFGFEFMERPDGYDGLVETYGLRFAGPPKTMELGLVYRALKEKQVDLIEGNSTDGIIEALDLFVLEDDRRYFPPYEAAPVVRRETLERFPQVREALDDLGGLLTEEQMRRLNYAVDGERRDVKDVVRELRRERGL